MMLEKSTHISQAGNAWRTTSNENIHYTGIATITHPILQLYMDSLLYWFSQYVYARLLAQAEEHKLCRFQKCLDVTPILAACQGYHQTGPGRKPIHVVSKLGRAMVVKLVLYSGFVLYINCWTGTETAVLATRSNRERPFLTT